MPCFIGIDLAWSGKNPTGLAALRYDADTQTATLLDLPTETILTDEQIITFVKQVSGEDATVVIAIDAPLTVPNVTGQRPVERQIGRAFSSFHASAHSANSTNLGKCNGGKVRGEVIVSMLDELGIEHTPVIPTGKPTRQVFEVYPHPAMIVLFKLNQILKYKRGTDRKNAFKQYQIHLKGLASVVPALTIPTQINLLSEIHLDKVGKSLKAYEDQLDAFFCAYLALYYWYWGTERCHIFGEPDNQYATGYIVSPIDERIKYIREIRMKLNYDRR